MVHHKAVIIIGDKGLILKQNLKQKDPQQKNKIKNPLLNIMINHPKFVPYTVYYVKWHCLYAYTFTQTESTKMYSL